MADLRDILFGISLEAIEGDRQVSISSLAFDSRKVKEGSLFVAIKGLTVDGHDFISQALDKGAVAILCEHFPDELASDVTYVMTSDSAAALGIAAANFYGQPSTKLKLVGITGTNGKTTTTTLLHSLFLNLGYRAGLISTVENKIEDHVLPAKFTTPDALQLNELLQEMVDMGCTHCFMEVSSHALVQQRVAGVTFAGAIFTNISHDHLDFHKTFDAYIEAKKMLFDDLKGEAFALVNIDDKRSRIMLQNTKASKYSFGIKGMADYKGKILTDSMQGLQMDIDNHEVWFKLVGEFNAYNLLTVYGTAALLGDDKEQVLATLSNLEGARGRFELVPNDEGIIAIVD
ncbi:MAG: UDP-N-acetylmuramoyl-L-alanyl-D-glutamate--2,6-diaminopimelate ligase, partial [Bacteroidota bacterium]